MPFQLPNEIETNPQLQLRPLSMTSGKLQVDSSDSMAAYKLTNFQL